MMVRRNWIFIDTKLRSLERDAAEILKVLQFTTTMMTEKPTEHLLGGWKMRLGIS
jgi:ATPase subunit of ABC transporter with duplicated ATPase domains